MASTIVRLGPNLSGTARQLHHLQALLLLGLLLSASFLLKSGSHSTFLLLHRSCLLDLLAVFQLGMLLFAFSVVQVMVVEVHESTLHQSLQLKLVLPIHEDLVQIDGVVGHLLCGSLRTNQL